MARATERGAKSVTTTEASVLALLAIEGEASGYDLLKRMEKSVGQVWAPARSRLYAVLPRLVEGGLARRRLVAQRDRPNKQLYRITRKGEGALTAWLETVEPGSVEPFYLKLFVGGLTTTDVLIAHVEQYRRDMQERLDDLLELEPLNTRAGHDYFHYFLLRLGIDGARLRLRWAESVLRELRGRSDPA